jgi:DNA processing protein
VSTVFGLDRADVESLAGAVSGASADEVFARAAWTVIAEPGDRIVGELIAAVGAPAALQLVIERASATDIVAAAREVADAGLDADEIDAALQRWMPRLASSAVQRALGQAARFGVRLLVPGDDDWPAGANDLGQHASTALWMRGSVEAVRQLDRAIALVGARAATGYGEHVTMEASAGLVDRGYAIVSGAAYGIDGMAHRAALASNGTTIAFLAGGLDRFYPSGHDALLTRIVEQGAVLSEVPCGVPPTKWRFLQRNRLIAAMSLATVVLEAGWRSGSLNTAGHAGTLGRPIGAVPGPVTSAASAGCHRLLREDRAVCVTNADEMAALAPLGPIVEREAGYSAHSSDASRLLDSMSARSQRAPDDLARRSGLSVGTVQSLLGALELDGAVREGERGWSTVPPAKESPATPLR